MAIFEPKPWVNPFGKNVNFSTVWTSLFYSLERRFFVLEYHKRHFPNLYCLKNKVGKMAIFGPKPWENVNFSTFWTSCFYSLERRFFVLEYHKRHFPSLFCQKRKDGKMVNLWPKPCINPFGKISIFATFWSVWNSLAWPILSYNLERLSFFLIIFIDFFFLPEKKWKNVKFVGYIRSILFYVLYV